jgi:DNA-binding transcriptional MerR regulator
VTNATSALPSKGSASSKPLGEFVFLSADVSRIAGVTKRQLQWWDERKVVSPRREAHRRVYVLQLVLEILTVSALRRKGLSLQKIRRVLRLMRRELGPQFSHALGGGPKLYLFTDGHSIHIDEQPERILKRLTQAKNGMYLVCLSDQIARVTSKKAPHRYSTTQLQLF